jgi:hypothetical protein
MKTKLGASLIAALMMMGLFGAANAIADPGPNGNNDGGLCTAYFKGSERGQEQKRQAPPFQGLEAAAEGAGQSVEEFCADKLPGQPEASDNGDRGNRP